MKKFISIMFSVFATFSLFGQNITGEWNGILKFQGIQLRIVFNISKTESGYTATMDSPDQGAKGIPVTEITFENAVVKMEIASAKIEYEGTLNKE